LVETATNTAIFDAVKREAQPGYKACEIGSTIKAEVLKRQKAVFQGGTFGFEEKNP
jgi:hypothetical protein